jgi:hypothetical protein
MRRHPPLRSGPSGASPIVFGLQIAIEAAVVAGSKHQQEKRHGYHRFVQEGRK